MLKQQTKAVQTGCQKKKKQNCAKARFLRATAAIIATFVITWLPYQILALVRVTCDENGLCQRITSKLTWLQAIIIARYCCCFPASNVSFSSTCINPFLYRFGDSGKKLSSKSCTNTETALRVGLKFVLKLTCFFQTNNSYSIKRTRSNSSGNVPGTRMGRFTPDRPFV